MATATISTAKKQHRARGVTRLDVTIVSGDGDGAAADIGAAFGRLVGIFYKPGTIVTGADLTLTDKTTGAVLWTGTDLGTSPLTIRPQFVPTGTLTKTALTPAAGYVGNQDLYVAGDMQLAVAQAGTDKTGVLSLIFDEGGRNSTSLGG